MALHYHCVAAYSLMHTYVTFDGSHVRQLERLVHILVIAVVPLPRDPVIVFTGSLGIT